MFQWVGRACYKVTDVSLFVLLAPECDELWDSGSARKEKDKFSTYDLPDKPPNRTVNKTLQKT